MKMKQQREERAKERLSVMERSEVPKLSEPEASFHLKEDEVSTISLCIYVISRPCLTLVVHFAASQNQGTQESL